MEFCAWFWRNQSALIWKKVRFCPLLNVGNPDRTSNREAIIVLLIDWASAFLDEENRVRKNPAESKSWLRRIWNASP